MARPSVLRVARRVDALSGQRRPGWGFR